jgi:hypothetical protein
MASSYFFRSPLDRTWELRLVRGGLAVRFGTGAWKLGLELETKWPFFAQGSCGGFGIWGAIEKPRRRLG